MSVVLQDSFSHLILSIKSGVFMGDTPETIYYQLFELMTKAHALRVIFPPFETFSQSEHYYLATTGHASALRNLFGSYVNWIG